MAGRPVRRRVRPALGDGLLPEPGAWRRPKSDDLLRNFPDLERDARVAAKLGLSGDAFYALPDAEQGLQIALYEKDRRKHECGHDIAVCGDPDREWFASRNVCYPSMLQAFANWRWDELYGEKFHDGTFKNWHGERTLQFRYGHRDGMDILVAETDLAPDDDFLLLEKYFGESAAVEGESD